jgi:antibiotic biosynthesis monooxygenase (ABM) superfamily enzyme
MNGSVSVVISRRVRAGAEREFLRWVSRISAAARRAPGFLGADLQQPDDLHPDEWVTVYRFARVDQLQAWLSSPRRAELLAGLDELLAGPVREQIVVEPMQAGKPVTVVTSQRVHPDRTEEFAEAHDRALAQLAMFPGFLRSELFPPVEGVTDEHVIVFASTRASISTRGSTRMSGVNGSRTLGH